MSLRVVVTGGGTGGHVYPGIAIARRLRRDHPGSEVLFIGSSTGPERKAAEAAGLDFAGLKLSGLVGKSPARALRSLILFGAGFAMSLVVLKRFGPHCVIGTGGYAAAPACFASRVLRIPLVLHEMNYRPGLVTRVLSRGALAVAAAHRGTAELLPTGAKVVVTGVAVRPEIEDLARSESRALARTEALADLGIDGDRRTLLIFGGSQGAEAINEAVWEALPAMSGREDLQLVHITGERGADDPRAKPGVAGPGDGSIAYSALPYYERIDLLYSVADLALARAGAGTVAELANAGLPAVLVPYPHAVGGHQEENALRLEEAGAARVIRQDGDTAASALEEALRLLYDNVELGRMKAAALSYDAGSGVEGILKLLGGI